MKRFFYNSSQKRIRSGWRLVIFFAIGTFLTVIYSSLAIRWMEPIYKSSLSSFFTNISFMYALYLVLKYISKQEFRDVGYQVDSYWYKDLLWGSIIGLLMFSMAFLIGYQFGVFEIIGFNYSIYDDPFAIALSGQFFRFFNTAMFEETIFRAFLMVTIAQGISGIRYNWQQSIWITTIATSLFFGLAHLGNDHANLFGTLNIIIAGVLLAITYMYTGRIGFAIGVHLMWNFSQNNIFGLPTSGGLSEVSLLEVQIMGSEWISGADFGPEGGLTGMIGFLIGFPLFYFYVRKTYRSIQFRIQAS